MAPAGTLVVQSPPREWRCVPQTEGAKLVSLVFSFNSQFLEGDPWEEGGFERLRGHAWKPKVPARASHEPPCSDVPDTLGWGQSWARKTETPRKLPCCGTVAQEGSLLTPPPGVPKHLGLCTAGIPGDTRQGTQPRPAGIPQNPSRSRGSGALSGALSVAGKQRNKELERFC